ncbi:hypothetical protein NQ317_004926 [Molorchus minor]|uniref:Uncharacterized protein n=1 Tax=Molorchus minor TaxID=1323400 RepID=A0ABQ9JV78_9CUCU|nr:hypothetical protein NQ317_004926 [Molorchus minor]
MNLILVIFISLFKYVYVYDLCAIQDDKIRSEKHVSDNCNIRSLNFDSRDCSQVTFSGNEKLKKQFG